MATAPRLKRPSIRNRLLVGFSALLLLISAFFFTYFPQKLKSQSLSAHADKITSIAAMTAQSISPGLYFSDAKGIEDVALSVRQNKDLTGFFVHDGAGRFIYRFGTEPAGPGLSVRSGRRPWLSADGRTIYVTRPVAWNSQRIGEVTLGFSLLDLRDRIARTRDTSIIVILVTSIVGAVVVFGLSFLITAPLKHLSETAGLIAGGDISLRARVSTRDEVGHLSETFNMMLDKLESARCDLEEWNRTLEHRVQERTQELEREIGERKQVEIDKARAETASREKSEFLANMSHELRTPLNAICGFAQVLEDRYFGALNAKQAEYMRDIRTSGEHLLGLINDILDIAKVESGKMDLKLAPVDLPLLLSQSFLMIKEKCARHNVALRLTVDEALAGLTITADARKLKQILYNLLSNAAKFTPDGGAISLEAAKSADKLVISVSDTGVGIGAEHLDRIFDEFFQVKGGMTDKTPGTGLGLSISRRYVQMHGGRIWAESGGFGKGCRFSFELPIKERQP